MKNKLLIIAAVLALFTTAGLLLTNSSNAASEAVGTENTLKTVSFDVSNMTCVTCPYTVRKTLQKIDGVTQADASLETKSATATFDPTKTSVDVMLKALKNQGYPSTVAEE